MKTQSELKLERFSVNSSGIVERMKGQIRGSGRVSPSFIGNVQFTHTITSVRDLIERLVTDGGKESKLTGEKYIVLPTLQREFLWGPEKIEDLFDSLLRRYPVGSLLLWKPSPKTANDEAKYKFIRYYVGRSNFPLDEVEKPVRHHSKQLSYSPSTDSFFFALDGQQRLTSFLIGLRGSYFDHRYRKHTDKRESYYEKKLCLNLAQNPLRERDAREHIYDFQFRKKKSLGDKQFEYNRDKQEYWWPISKIWNAKTEQKLKETTTEAIGLYPGQETEVHECIKQNISQLYQAIIVKGVSF